MRYTFFLLLTFVGIHTGYSQIPTGTKMLTGYINILGNSQKDADASLDESSYFRINFSPRLGKFYKDNCALGGGFILGYQHEYDALKTNIFASSNTMTQTSNTNTFTIGGLYFMKFYKSLTDNVYLNLETGVDASLGYSYSRSVITYSSGNPSQTNKSDDGSLTSRIYATPGFTWFLTDKLAFDLSVGSLYYLNRIDFNNTLGNLEQVSHSYGLSLRSSTVYAGITLFL